MLVLFPSKHYKFCSIAFGKEIRIIWKKFDVILTFACKIFFLNPEMEKTKLFYIYINISSLIFSGNWSVFNDFSVEILDIGILQKRYFSLLFGLGDPTCISYLLLCKKFTPKHSGFKTIHVLSVSFCVPGIEAWRNWIFYLSLSLKAAVKVSARGGNSCEGLTGEGSYFQVNLVLI